MARFRRPTLPERELAVRAQVISMSADAAQVDCSVSQDGQVVLADGLATLITEK